jgi:hypothetical protein
MRNVQYSTQVPGLYGRFPPISAARCSRREQRHCVRANIERLLVSTKRPPIRVMLVGSINGRQGRARHLRLENRELRRTAVPVHLDRQNGAFHGTNRELSWQYSATRVRPSPQPLHDGHDNNDDWIRLPDQVRRRSSQSNNARRPRPERCRGVDLAKGVKYPAKPRDGVWQWLEWVTGPFRNSGVSTRVAPKRAISPPPNARFVA